MLLLGGLFLHIILPVMSASAMHELRRRARAEGSLHRYEPCLPRPAKQPRAGPDWIHEIKYDGFRIVAYRIGRRLQLLTRDGYDFADRDHLQARLCVGVQSIV
jgi:ATP-dependent DNA ligase